MAEAVNYCLNQWNELNVFTADGAVPIDNNVSERDVKRIVLNRKNSLFVGNERGGQTAAILSSLASTCKRHGVDPQRYLTQLLTNLPATPISQLADWLPEAWQRRNSPPAWRCGSDIAHMTAERIGRCRRTFYAISGKLRISTARCGRRLSGITMPPKSDSRPWPFDRLCQALPILRAIRTIRNQMNCT
jgi:hypothetical protein